MVHRDRSICNYYNRPRFTVFNSLWWCVPTGEAVKSCSVLCAGEVVHKEIHRGTYAGKHFSTSHEKYEGIYKLSSNPQSWLEQWNDSNGDEGNGKHNELDGQSDEHFSDADLFAGQTGGSLAAPTNSLGESDSSDDGGNQHDDWTTYRQTKPVKHAIQSADHGFIPEVVIVDGNLPVNPLHAKSRRHT